MVLYRSIDLSGVVRYRSQASERELISLPLLQRTYHFSIVNQFVCWYRINAERQWRWL